MSALSSGQLYLAMITLAGMSSMGSPNFGYGVVTTPTALWGNVFSFLAATNHAVIVNTFVLGLHSLWKGVPASRLLHIHVVLFVSTYMIALVMNFLLWDSNRLEWSTAMTGYVPASYSQVKDGLDATATAGAGFVAFNPPAELVGIVAAPFFIFNFVVLPLGLFMSQSTCRLVSVTVNA